MTRQQLLILNSLVTYAVENIPWGPSPSEQEVAQIVGRWVLEVNQITATPPKEPRWNQRYWSPFRCACHRLIAKLWVRIFNKL